MQVLSFCVRVRFIFKMWQLFTAVILVAHNLYFGSVVSVCVTGFLHSPLRKTDKLVEI